MRATTTRVCTLLVCWGVIACGDDDGFSVPQTTISSPISEEPAADPKVASCDGASNGMPCGKVGSRMHCVLNDCVKNACGDGVVADGEECDDGNERNEDGCDSRCTAEPPPGCGNGVVEAAEQCDDGNTKDDDQCTHICTAARCGDRIVSRGEECDDGNANDTDGCSNRCRLAQHAGGAGGAGGSMTPTAAGSSAAGARALAGAAGVGGRAGAAGSGVAGTAAGSGGAGGATAGRGGAGGTGSAGVGTSGAGAAGSGSAGTGIAGTGAAGTGNAGAGVGGAAGSGASGSGASGSGASGSGASGSGGSGNPACSACRTQYCRDYQGSGLDLVAGCFETINGDLGADPSDPNFIQDCVDVMQCAFQNNCAYAVNGASDCYCGSAVADECISNGPAADAKCVPQVQKASRSTVNTDITLRMSDFAYPMGWAFFLLECDRDFCRTQCAPP